MATSEAHELLQLALKDLHAAQILAGHDLWHLTCFHAQQAAEKGLKAVLASRGTPFPKTHDIERLAAMVSEDFTIVPSLASACAVLSEYGVTPCYEPRAAWGIDLDEAQQAIALATDVLSYCQDRVRTRAGASGPPNEDMPRSAT